MRHIARLSNRTLSKTVVSGGGQSFVPPSEWITTLYGSGWPIAPVAAPRDTDLPRTIDYPISVNATLTPRTGYGLMPFAALLEAYENVTEVRTPVELLCREMRSFIKHLVDDEGNEVQDHPMQWLCERPDGVSPIDVFITRLIKTAKIYDAPAVYMNEAHGQIDGMHYIDGSTLFLIVDEQGRMPQPESLRTYLERQATQPTASKGLDSGWPMGPTTLDQFVERLIARQQDGADIPDKMPAFAQVIKGTPFAWWSADQIFYQPDSPRVNSPYGESFIEIAWSWIMVIVNLTAFELGHYRTGNMPEGFVTLAKDEYANIPELLAQELQYNARMSGNAATERMRLRFFPDGTKYIPTKKPDFPDRLYNQAWKNIMHAIGVPPSELGDVPGGGLGGKGFKEGAMSDLSRNALNPIRAAIAEPFNYVLRRNGVTDVKFEVSFPTDEIDPDKLKEGVYDGMAHGTLSLNDALGELNLDPVGDPDDHSNIANKHLIVAGSAIYVVEDMQTQNGMAVPTFTGKPGGNTGGTPAGPETAVQQMGAEHTPDDHKTVERVIRNILGTGTIDGKFYSLPQRTKMAMSKEEPPVQFEPEADPVAVAEQIGDDVGDRRERETPRFAPDSSENNPGVGVHHGDEQYQIGMAEEAREHPQLNVSQIADLVRDHLRQDPEYYKPGAAEPGTMKLSKHCGVCPEDDDYYGAPISREAQIDWPHAGHANSVEIVAMNPPGLPAKAALWKPEGGEREDLNAFIGGPQYAREEAAYLLDRSLGFYLVPVAYVAEADAETGAAVYYTFDAEQGKPVNEYAPEWIERAAVFDYFSAQQDRHEIGHNYMSHPDDPTRPILIDNGLSFPADMNENARSPFTAALVNVPLSSETLMAIARCLNDAATWSDIQALVGPEATAHARLCGQRLLNEKMITPDESYTQPSVTGVPIMESDGGIQVVDRQN